MSVGDEADPPGSLLSLGCGTIPALQAVQMLKNFFVVPLHGMIVAALLMSISPLASAQSITVEDALNAEAIGNAIFSPDGRYLVFERGYRYKDRDDFSSLIRMAQRGSLRSDEVFVYDTHSARPARPLLLPKPGVRRWLGGMFWVAGFSPSGKHVLLYEMEDGQVNLTAVELATGKPHRFRQPPDFSEGYHTTRVPIWSSDHAVIYAALEDGVRASVPATRRIAGEGYVRAWNQSWNGLQPSYTEWSTGASRPVAYGLLVSQELRSSRPRVLARGRFENLQLSPDSKYLAAIGPTADHDVANKSGSDDCIDAEQGIVLFSISTGGGSAITCGSLVGWQDRGNKVVWSPDSKSVAYYAWSVGQGPERGTHRVFDVSIRSTVEYQHDGIVLESSGSTGTQPWPLDFVWNGSSLIVSGRPASDASASGIAPLTVSDIKLAERSWYRLLPQGARAESLSEGLPEGAKTAIIDAQLYSIQRGQLLRYERESWSRVDVGGNAEAFLAATFDMIGLSQHVIRGQLGDEPALASLGDDGFARVISEFGQGELLAFDRSASSMLRSDGMGGYFVDAVGRADQRSGTAIAKIQEPHIAARSAPCAMLTYSSGQGGSSLQSSVALPAGFKKFSPNQPMVVVVYPSLPRTSCNDLREATLLLASNGFVVMDVATPGSVQRTSAARPWDGMPGLVEDAVETAIREGYASPGNIGLFGFSQGAHAALWVASQSRMFSAIAVHNGHSDSWQQYFHSGRSGEFGIDESPPRVNENFEREYGDVGMGASALDTPGIYIDNSAIRHASSISAPVLLINSDMDSFSRGQFESMYAALDRAGKSARLVTFWGEGHHMASPANIRAFYALVSEWFRSPSPSVQISSNR